MKKILRASLSAVLVLSLVGCGSTKDEAIYQDSIDAYVNEIDMDYAYDFTKTLSTDTSLHDNSLGFRTSGSDAEHRTANYLAKEMKAIGLKNVEKIPVNVDKWQYNDASLTIEGTDIDLMPVSYMVNGTDENGITAQIVDCGTGFAKDYEDKDVEGKIALVGVDQFNESWIGGYIYEAYEHGAKALVTYDLDGYGRFSDDDHQIQDVCAEDIMPTTIITMSEYKQIKKALKQGHDMATLKVDSVMEEGNGTSYDVVGYIPGKSHDQQIIFAGHYDMYFTGFQDDCSAIGTIMSMAKTMIDSGYVPENDIVVVAHGAEEWGATGTEFDWTRGAYELINNVHPEWANKTLAVFKKEVESLNAEGQDINDRYIKAVSSKSDVTSIQKEGKAYNKKVLDLFKYVQDNFVGIVFSSDVVMKHVGYQNNIEYMDEIIQDLKKDKVKDALDVAYQLNGLCEYNYYLFSPNAAAKIDAHADKAVENNKWWGNDKGYYFTDTKNATTSLLNKEDGDDVSEEIKVYESARTQQLDYYKEALENEILAMNEINQ